MKRSRGFKLLEVMVATSIFFIVSIVFLNLLPASFWATKKADNVMTAHAVAASKLEALRSAPFSELVLGSTTQEAEVRNGTEFSLTIEIGEVSGRDPDLLKDVVVTLTWNERSGAKTARVQTYITAVKR